MGRCLHCPAMLRPRSSRLVLLALIAGALVAAGALLAGSPVATAKSRTSHHQAHSPSQTALPQGFVGVDVDGPLYGPYTPVDINSQLGRMVASGVQSIRVAFDWETAQPYKSWSQVPGYQREEFTHTAGAPTDFQVTDQIVGDAARRGLSILPTVMYAADWDAKHSPKVHFATPSRPAPYAAYLTALIGRYGPQGSFWKQNPDIPNLPIRSWQIWNEPNIWHYWPQPFAASYVSLLRSAHAAVKHADPGAQVVLGALTNFSWDSWLQLNRVKGSSRLYDAVSINAFTKEPANVIRELRLVRNAMNRAKVHKPLLLTEWSWPSALGKTPQHYDWNTTEAGQARNIATLLPMLGRARGSLGLIGFDYYTWMSEVDPGSPAFDFAGLLSFKGGNVVAKPALSAFTKGVLALEHCARKGALASSCIK
jgi:hypothetical protein